jgi:hypothetical protein
VAGRTVTAKGKTVLIAIIIAVICMLWSDKANAGASLLANNGTVSNSDIAAAMQKVGFSQSFAQAAANASSNVEDRTGQLAIYNGSCCTGLLQMNQTNLGKYCSCTSTQYAGMTLDQQVQIWANFERDQLNSPGIKGLDALVAKGTTTFDGQPIDDALKIGCTQPGIGFCQQMVAAGVCGTYGIQSGLTICQFATKIRQGPGNIGNTTAQTSGTANSANEDAGSAMQSPYTRATGGDSIPMGNGVYCWSCDAILYALKISEVAATSSFATPTGATTTAGTMLDNVYNIMLIAGLVAILWRILIAIVAGIDPIRYTLATAIRLALVMSVLGNGGSIIGQVMVQYVMVPALAGGAGLGSWLSTQVAGDFGIALDNITVIQGAPTSPTNSDCAFGMMQPYVTLNYLQDVENPALSLACSIHRAMTTQVQIGMYIATSMRDASNAQQLAAEFAVNVAGLLISMVGMIGMFKFGMIFLDVSVSMAVAIAFAPWAIYCWVFDTMRRSFSGLMRRALHGFLSFTMAGITAVAALILLLSSMQASMGLSSATPSAILIAAQQVIQGADLNNSSSLAPLVQLCLFTVGGALAANHLLTQSQLIVSGITGIQVSQVLSKAVEGAVTSTASMGLGAGAGLAAALSGPMGRISGRIAGKILEE